MTSLGVAAASDREYREYRFLRDDKDPADELVILLREEISADYGLFLWPCGEVLSWFLWRNPGVVQGQVVLELGAGVGLPSLLAARLGAKHVSITDRADGVQALANVREAVEANGLADTCDIFPFSWGHFEDMKNGTPGHGVILGSDVFFSSEHLDSVLATVHWLLHWRAPPSSPRKFYVTYQERSPNRSIRTLLSKWGLTAASLPLDDFLPDDLAHDSRFSSVHLLVLEPASPPAAVSTIQSSP